MRVVVKTKKLKELLLKNNLSQKWLAIQVGRSPQHISNLISGKSPAGPKVRDKILLSFKSQRVKFDDIFKIVD